MLVKLLRTRLRPYKKEIYIVIALQAVANTAALLLPTLNARIIDDGPAVAGESLFEATVRNRAHPASMEPYLQLAAYLLDDRSSWLSGSLLSARWDSIERLEATRAKIIEGSLLRLRRIDDSLFTQIVAT